MVLKRRIDQGFNGNHSPAIPRAPRSVRRRVLHKKDLESSQICAFELLAAVAGKLLEESECSSASCSAAMGLNQCAIGIKQEPQDVDKPLPTEPDEHGSSEESVFFSGLQKEICKEKPEIANEAIRQHSSPIVTSACSDRVDSNLKPVLQKKEDEFVKLPSETEGGSPNSGESHDSNIETGLDKKEEIKGGVFRAYATANKFSPRDQLGFGEKFLSSNVEVSLGRDSVPDPFLRHRKNVEVRNRDDDGIHFHCSQYSSKMKTYRSKTRIGDQRIRKLLTSKYWKVVPKLKDCEHSNVGSVGKHIYHKRSFNPIERSQCNTPFKKRKLFDRSSVVTYDRGISCESVSNSLDKSVAENKNGSSGKLQEGSGVSSSSTGCQNSLGSRNSNVGFSIKSFNVPELFVEVPETATVGSLKRTVLEAVTAVLNDGLRVGVLVHGKKIRDDNKTLFQSGISESNDLNSLGFTLEPNSPTPTSPPVLSENTSLSPGPDSPKCVNRSKAAPKEDKFLLETPDKAPTTASNEHPSQSLDPASNDHPSKSHDLVPTPTIEPENKTSSDSKALVPLPEANMEALAVVPVNQRSRRPEIGQRRTRRPFSVAEVEALVRAVEKLGTGRWRDVKLCAFENAKHRTYVDLKDKWKTLVHTARISPQQRRGEPVPQKLLDRVLVAQAFWSDHQAKQHGKPTPPLLPPPLPGIPDSPAKRAGN